MIKVFFIFCAMYGYRSPLVNKVDPRCYEQNYVRAWVYFTDKGVSINNYAKALESVTARMNESSLHRRMARGGTIDYGDIPLNDQYIEEIEARGGLLLRKSKWLNAASYTISKLDLDKIAELDFVHKIVKVTAYKHPDDIETAVRLDSTLFGLTYNQLHMFNIDQLHEQGWFGSNVKIGILDTGVRRKHIALDNVRVVAEHDFIDGDQMFMNNYPITQRVGVFSDMVFWKTGSKLNVFYSCDTSGQFNLKPSREIMYIYSTDGGSQWQPEEKLTEGYRNWTRELDVCGRDTMFLFYRDAYGLKYIVYEDTILYQSRRLALGKEPSAVQIADTVYVAFQDSISHYLALMKGNAVDGFAGEIIIDSSLCHIKAPKAISSGSEIGIFYHILPNDSLFFTKSSIPAGAFTRRFLALGKDAEAISSGDTILAIWKDKSNDPLFRIAFSKSTDFGTTFSSPLYLSDDLNSIGKLSIQKFNETVTVMWDTEGRIYYRTSYDNGNGFTALDSLNKEFVYHATLGTNNSGIFRLYCERGDSVTDGYAVDDPEYGYPRHGTEMLSIIGGYMQYSYIGVAPAAEFYVARTEIPGDSLYEFPIEEDTWISGLEWFESKGCDIVNSSLGYTQWYNWPDDYDGNTSPASIAANEAARRGVIVVNASGNLSFPMSPQIHIPGDAEGVITVGGIDTLFSRWQNSGYYPTPDHSTKKPEIVCLSDAPIVVEPDSSNSYLYSRGTSGATAMVSGICALLLDGHPQWNVDSVKAALIATASYADSPTDSMGYGWPNALAAFYWPDTIDPNAPIPGSRFMTPFPNPFILSQHDTIYIPFQLEQSHTVEIRLYSITGRLIKTENRGLLLPGQYTNTDPQTPNAAFMWDGIDDGAEASSGLYYCLLITRGGGNDITKIAVIR